MADDKVGLGAAAAALEAELRRFEQVTDLAAQLEERAREIQSRRELLDALLARFARLGNEAAEVNDLLKQGGRVDEAEERLGRVAASAEELLRDAERDGFEDAVRQAESVRQQSLSARNKLKLLREKT